MNNQVSFFILSMSFYMAQGKEPFEMNRTKRQEYWSWGEDDSAYHQSQVYYHLVTDDYQFMTQNESVVTSTTPTTSSTTPTTSSTTPITSITSSTRLTSPTTTTTRLTTPTPPTTSTFLTTLKTSSTKQTALKNTSTMPTRLKKKSAFPSRMKKTLTTPTKPITTSITPIKLITTSNTPTKPITTSITPIKLITTSTTPTKPITTSTTPTTSMTTSTTPITTLTTTTTQITTSITPITTSTTTTTQITTSTTLNTTSTTAIATSGPTTSPFKREIFMASSIDNISMRALEDNPCETYNPRMPTFSRPGRRVSQVKCYEYIWGIKYRKEKESRIKKCANKNKEGGFSVIAAIGGRETVYGEFPHMGAIGWKATEGAWIFKCGASLISSKFVLTAAHCSKASPRDPSISDTVPKIVRLGDKNIIDTYSNGVIPVDAIIMRIFVHPRYEAPKKYNDIAVIELQNDVEFTDLIQPACLWGQFNLSELGSQATLTGWGAIETTKYTTSPELQAAVVDIIDTATCDTLLRRYCNRHWCGIKDQICGGKLSGGVDSCQGDSGGPLQVKINLPSAANASMHYVIGVTSFGVGCGRPNVPGVYARISSYIDWIESVVWP